MDPLSSVSSVQAPKKKVSSILALTSLAFSLSNWRKTVMKSCYVAVSLFKITCACTGSLLCSSLFPLCSVPRLSVLRWLMGGTFFSSGKRFLSWFWQLHGINVGWDHSIFIHSPQVQLSVLFHSVITTLIVLLLQCSKSAFLLMCQRKPLCSKTYT